MHPAYYVVGIGVAIGAAILTLFLSREQPKPHRYPDKEFVDPSEVCTVCLDNITSEFHKTYLECGHNFHSRCIRDWIRVKNICPNCKRATRVQIR